MPTQRPPVDEQVEREPLFPAGDRRRPHLVDQRAFDLGTRRRASRVDDAGERVPTLAGELQLTLAVPVEHRSHGDELVDAARALVDEHAHGVDVAQPVAGRQGVGQVEVGRVGVAPQHGRHASLRPSRGGLRQVGLGQHPHSQRQFVGGP